jgi:hypothetical protein
VATTIPAVRTIRSHMHERRPREVHAVRNGHVRGGRR